MAGAHSAAILRTLCMTTERRNLFDLSWRAIAKVLVAAALVWAWFQLWQFVMVMIVSIIMAIALDPSVRWLERRRLSRSMGSVVVMLLVSAVLMAMIAASWMTLRDQSQLIVQRLTESIEQLRTSIPILQHVFPTGGEGASGGVSSYVVGFARSATTAIGMIVLALALTVYLLIEWKRTLEWLMAFVPERHRSKARKTLEEARGIVFHYAVGNAISSAITGIVTYAVLAWLGVPAALMLALISGMLNFIPVIGFILSSVLAAMLAATVSPNVLLMVVAFYLVFNLIESYLIAPKVFGHEMELSNLAVIVAVIVGAELGGVMGGLLALPVAAVYPTIERIWLRDRLVSDTVETHKRISA
jgi:predicted PurR-regulated permease PerM